MNRGENLSLEPQTQLWVVKVFPFRVSVVQVRAYIQMSTQAEVLVTEPPNCGITDTISYLLPDSIVLLNNGGIKNNYYYVI